MVVGSVRIKIVEVRLYTKPGDLNGRQILAGSLEERNAFASGNIDNGNQGFAHLEFAVAPSDCTVTALTLGADMPLNTVGSVSFMSNTGTVMTMVVTDFVLESSEDYYTFYVNGWVARDYIELSPA